MRERVNVLTDGKRPLSLLLLILLLLGAGAALGLFEGFVGQDDPVRVVVENTANSTYAFEVWIVEYPSEMTVHRQTGGDYVDEIGPGLSTTEAGDYHRITGMELPDSARLQGRYLLDSNETKRFEVAEFPTDFAIVVVIYQREQHVPGYVSAHCGGTLAYFEVAMRYYGSDSAYICR